MEKVFSAIPTPFLDDKIDLQSLENVIEYNIKHGVEGLVFAGSTGEWSSLSQDEWKQLIDFGVKTTQTMNKKYNKNAVVITGCGFNYTKLAVEYAKLSEELGVNYILATTPSYNKPQQEGIYQHFSEICNAVKTKIILYNVPSRTGTDMKNDTIIKLAKDFNQIVGLKDASGDLKRVVDLYDKLHYINRQDDFKLLSGDDETQIGFNAMGGSGVVSVVANIAPKLICEIQDNCKNNNYSSALTKQPMLYELSKAMFCETNPVPVKYALQQLGIFKSAEVRKPLIELGDESKVYIQNTISTYLK